MRYIDGNKKAFLGIGYRAGNKVCLVYSLSLLLDNHVELLGKDRNNLTAEDWEEIQDYVSYNIEGAYVGEDTPIIIDDISEEQEQIKDEHP